LSENSLITDCKSGFRPKSLVDRWLKNIDEVKLTDVLFIDLLKAFDTVNNTILLHKLKSFGICNGTFEWFKSYFTNRTQRVSWKDILSDEKNITIGVPQGSILGRMFFLILYINDYPQAMKHSHVNMYAYDT
jgi:hypothetical protein